MAVYSQLLCQSHLFYSSTTTCSTPSTEELQDQLIYLRHEYLKCFECGGAKVDFVMKAYAGLMVLESCCRSRIYHCCCSIQLHDSVELRHRHTMAMYYTSSKVC